MSMRITSFQVKELSGLLVPLSALLKQDPYARLQYSERNKNFRVNVMESYIEGRILPSVFEVTNVAFYGEGSGTLLSTYLEPVLKKSTGYMKALLVWEGGEIEAFECKDGKFSYKQVEIKI